MRWEVRKVHSTYRRTVALRPVERGLNEEEAGEGEGDGGGGFGDLIGNYDGEKATEGPSCTESVSAGCIMTEKVKTGWDGAGAVLTAEIDGATDPAFFD